MATAEYYERLINNIRVERQRAVEELGKVQIICEEQKEEINTLRKEYRDAMDTNETLEQVVMRLEDKLEMKCNENKGLRRESVVGVEEKLFLENKQLKEQLSKMRNKYENLVTKLQQRDSFEVKKNDIPSVNEDPPLVMEQNKIEQLLLQMANQHEKELETLKVEYDEVIALLEKQLEIAINDKEEVSKMYLEEVETLDLALADAVSQLADESIQSNEARRASLENDNEWADKDEQHKIDILSSENSDSGDVVEMCLNYEEDVQLHISRDVQRLESKEQNEEVYHICAEDISTINTKESSSRV